MEKVFARVVVDLTVPGIGNKYFHYLVPSGTLTPLEEGMRVLVPFGGRKLTGFITGFDSQPEIDAQKVKKIIKILDPFPLITEELMNLASWISQFYLSPLVEVLKAILPNFSIKVKAREELWVKIKGDPVEIIDNLERLKNRAPKQALVITVLLQKGEMPLKRLIKECQTSRQTVKALENKGLVELNYKRLMREPLGHVYGVNPKLKLNEQQAEALKIIKNSMSGKPETLLLHGITGSGKTEVYLQAIEEVIKQKKEAIVMVPEISLTPQMVAWFRGRFGDMVTVLHSKLSQGERYDQWLKILKGEVKIVVGPRSAVFAPFSNLGIIIIDEEHETTYKQEKTPRYDAREVARRRSEVNKCPLILGSATPSVESYYEALKGTSALIKMDKRVEDRPLPPVKVVDVREEIRNGNRTLFSRELYWGIKNTLEKKQQVILFINRRGFATFVVCKECGYIMRCPHCSITLNYHRYGDLLKCHYCYYKKKVPPKCPNCHGSYIRFLGLGTQRVEKEVKDLFPSARILRMDVDATTRKGSHQEIFKTFKRGEADILIGTQMVAKGLDFPRVTLVGVIAADTALNLPDFRAGERTFQLLTQVAGRTGRSSLGGKVIIQTYTPEHYSISSAKTHNYEAFFNDEIKLRKDFGYPPFSSLLRVVFSGLQEKDLARAAGEFKESLGYYLRDLGGEILGPGPCPLSKIKGRYRWHLVLKSKDVGSINKAVKTVWEQVYRKFDSKDIRIIIDINPINML